MDFLGCELGKLATFGEPTVQGHLVGQRDWSVSTVRTLMERMAVKGLLTSEKLN